MKEVYLHGELGELYGKHYTLNVKTPLDAIRLLSCQLDGMTNYMKNKSFTFIKDSVEMGEEDLLSGIKENGSLHIIPYVGGSKKGGIGQIILGAVIVASAFAFAPASGLGASAFSAGGASITFGNIAGLGASIIFGGVSQALTPTPNTGSVDAQESPDQRASFLIQSPTNKVQEGNPIALVYGKIEVGSVLVSAGLNIEQI